MVPTAAESQLLFRGVLSKVVMLAAHSNLALSAALSYHHAYPLGIDSVEAVLDRVPFCEFCRWRRKEFSVARLTEETAVHRWPLWLYRGSSTVFAILVVAQPVLAGQFLSGAYSALLLHSTNANVIAGAAFIVLAAAIVFHVLGRGPRWPIAVSAAEFGVVTLQVTAGHLRWMALHIPLGVGVVALSILLAAESWRKK
ncbi:MAG TPA: hypothetical protein VGD71_03840 [Kribbella sp.]